MDTRAGQSSREEVVTEPVSIEDTSSLVKSCLNCGTPITDAYCPHCGQKDMPKRQTLSELAFSFVSSFSGYESKFFRTCAYLLTKPGFLASEYNAGRRERYFHPARMYAFISVIYFFLLTALPGDDKSGTVLKVTKDGKDIDIASGETVDLGDELDTRERYDSLQNAMPVQERDGWLERKWKYKSFYLRERFEGNPSEFAGHVINDFISHFSLVFFFLLPVFAFLLWLLHLKRDFFYSEHLVFSTWFYNFFFVAGSVAMLAETVPWFSWIGIVVDFATLVYLLFAMRRTYGESWGKTILKYASFVILFGICIVFGLLVNLFITLMFV